MTDDYESLGARLAGLGLLLTPAELHGVVCGQLCSQKAAYSAALTARVLAQDEPQPELATLLQTLAADTQDALTLEDDFTFEPLLPDEDEELGLRLHALGRWCEGFTLGFAAGCSASGAPLPEEAREVLADFSRIAEVAEAEEDDSESDYMEVMEYVRVAAATLYRDNSGMGSADEDVAH